jgi:hypothetical protein
VAIVIDLPVDGIGAAVVAFDLVPASGLMLTADLNRRDDLDENIFY